MKKLLLLIVVIILTIAYFTKPDDKTCMIAAVNAVWGDKVPRPESTPRLYERFMDLNSKQVVIDDWIFMKRIGYRFPNKEYRLGFALFDRIVMND